MLACRWRKLAALWNLEVGACTCAELIKQTEITLDWGALFKGGWPVSLRLEPESGLSYLILKVQKF